MGPELLLGAHFSLPDSNHQIDYQRTVASLRRFANLLRSNVLEQLVFQPPHILAARRIEVTSEDELIGDRPYLTRIYSEGDLLASYTYPKLGGPEDIVMVTKGRNGQEVEFSINRLYSIIVVIDNSEISGLVRRFGLSNSPTDLRCKISTDCASGSYQQTVSPQTEYPAISNATTLIRDMTQQVVTALS